MPSFPYTPATLTLTGGEFNPEPIRFSFAPAFLRLTAGAFTIGPTLSSGVTAAIEGLLDTLFASESIVDEQGRPTRRFQEIWQNVIGGIKDILSSQGSSISELEAIYSAINTAQATATQAVQTANTTQAAVSLSSSYPDPPGVLRAASDGTITIAAHERVYGDGSRVAVNGGSVSGFAAGTTVTVFYTDPAGTGGAVAYQGNAGPVAQTGDTLVVGAATIPEVGEPATAGTGVSAPGYVPPDYTESDALYFSDR